MLKRTMTTMGLAALTVGLMSTAAAAQESPVIISGQLEPLNDSGVTADATIELDRETNQATVTIDADGLLAGFPHAQHIHGVLGEAATCPDESADTDGDGFVDTVEGQPTYGPILASLTTEGDTSPDSALAVERFPTYDDGTYTRTIELPDDVANELSNLHIVIHGMDTNGNGKYDDSAGTSKLMDGVPLEATLPAACGTLAVSASGGVQTGGGGTADTTSTAPWALAAFGGLTVAGLAYGVTRRRRIVEA